MKKMMNIHKERRRKEMKEMMRKEEGFTLVELGDAVQHLAAQRGLGLETDGTTATAEGGFNSSCSVAFEKQLTLYSDIAGVTAVGSSAGAKGPYVKKGKLPENPFNGLNTVKCDKTLNDITTVVTDGSTGWLFYTQTGRLVANDGAHDSI